MNFTPYKNALETERAQLYTQLQELGIQNPGVPKDWIATPEDSMTNKADQNIAADRSEDWIERRGEVAALETRYNNIMRALKKIKDDTYGMCEVSGEQIEEDRLQANPAARTCKKHMGEETNLPN